MKIEITTSTLCTLLGGRLSYDACEAICEYFDDCAPDCAPSIGDIAISFSEIPQDWAKDYDEDNFIRYLDNGNILISN